MSTKILLKTFYSQSLVDILSEFFSFILTQKRYSVNTCDAYYRDINDFLAFLSQRVDKLIDLSDLHNLTAADFRSWLANRLNNHVNSSNARALSSLRSFFKFLEINELLINSEIKKIKTPKISNSVPKAIDKIDIDKILQYIDNTQQELWQIKRDKAIITLIYGCGLRISEALSLVKNSISKSHIRVFGKGRKERLIPILPIVSYNIEQYLKISPFVIVNNQGIFLSNSGLALNRRYVNAMLIKIRRDLNLSEFISPHAFRHSFATHLLESDVDLKSIQQLLGHKNLSTTERYTKINKSKLLSSYAKFQKR